MSSYTVPDDISSRVSHLLSEQPNSSLLRYSFVFTLPSIGEHSGSSTCPILLNCCITCSCLAFICSSYGSCCHLQPPQSPKCWHIGSTRLALYLWKRITSASQYECFFLRICTSTTSPGTQNGTNTTMSFHLKRLLPSAATDSIVTFSTIGSSFFFLPII